jgi:hypothetical protein
MVYTIIVTLNLIRNQYREPLVCEPGRAVGIGTACGLNCRGVGVRVPVRSEFSPLHIVQTGSGVHPVSLPMVTGDSLSGGKAAGA